MNTDLGFQELECPVLFGTFKLFYGLVCPGCISGLMGKHLEVPTSALTKAAALLSVLHRVKPCLKTCETYISENFCLYNLR